MSKEKLDEAKREQWSDEFVQKMLNRVLVGFFKYGSVSRNADKYDFIANVRQRIDKYETTGNTEWLIDAANFLMFEFMIPKHPEAHFQGTDAAASPGVVLADGSQWHGPAGQDA